MFNPIIDIDRRIEDLQRLKNNYSNLPQQQPINIYNNNTPTSEFKAQFLNENEKVEDLLVNCKTCFISPQNRFVAIKEINGDITKYEIVIPKTEQELRIEELERKVSEYEQLINANNEIEQPDTINNVKNEPSTKRTSKSIS